MAMNDLPALAEQAAGHILASHHVVAFTGAGVSTESGIADFRGPGGLWTKFGEPASLGWERFLGDPRKWWEARLRGDARFTGRCQGALGQRLDRHRPGGPSGEPRPV